MSQDKADVSPSKDGEPANAKDGKSEGIELIESEQPRSKGSKTLAKQGTVQTNVDEDLLAKSKESAKARIRKQLITKDSFIDDFNFSRIGRALTMTYREGKADKAAALAKAGGKK